VERIRGDQVRKALTILILLFIFSLSTMAEEITDAEPDSGQTEEQIGPEQTDEGLILDDETMYMTLETTVESIEFDSDQVLRDMLLFVLLTFFILLLIDVILDFVSKIFAFIKSAFDHIRLDDLKIVSKNAFKKGKGNSLWK